MAGEKELPWRRPLTQHELHVWARDPFLWPHLLEMYEAAYGHVISVNQMQGNRAWLIDRLEEAFRRQHLVLIDHDLDEAETGGGSSDSDSDERGGDKGAASSKSVAVATPDLEVKTWFRARLIDEEGQPMANEDYVLIDTDGARRQGKLDTQGEVYIPAILPPGNCTISFPNIHLNPRKRK